MLNNSIGPLLLALVPNGMGLQPMECVFDHVYVLPMPNSSNRQTLATGS